MDKLSRIERSENMRRIRSVDTSPELLVRSVLHRAGFRYRLHVPTLPGKPDLVFPSRRKIVFVHGCFWHLHSKCREGRIPSSRRAYWESKLKSNCLRDARNRRALKKLGWEVFVVWECELAAPAKVLEKVTKFLS